MTSRFERVPFDTQEASRGPLIHIFRRNGKSVATVTQHQWFEPDGHEHTGYAELITSSPQPVDEVLPRYGKTIASVAIEHDDLWQSEWGQLR